MNFAPNSAAARDIAHVMHAYTNQVAHQRKGPFMVSGGKGIYIYDENGKEYIESLCGLWCASLGYSEEALIEAAIKQMRILPTYHTFAHKSSTPSIDLAEKIKEVLPVPMSKVFFANSGSEANDTLVKLIRFYNNAKGRPKKKKIISRERAYHGVTLVAASLTGLAVNHRDFDLPLDGILHTACPDYYHGGRPGESEEGYATRLADELDQLIVAEGPETVAAFIAEPVIGAGGALTPPATYFDKVQAVLEKHDVLFCVDEVICGFGRTGNMFACETYDLKPATITMAKALSAAYMPISALAINEELYSVIAAQSDRVGTLAHGFTYSGHPVPAAVALRTIEIYQERNVVDHVRDLTPHFHDRLHAFTDHPMVGTTSGVGLMGGVEYVADKATKKAFEPAGKVAPKVTEFAELYGLIARPMFERTVFAPPLIITHAEMDEMFDRYAKALDDTWAWVQEGGLDRDED